jgi:hypothetical protein
MSARTWPPVSHPLQSHRRPTGFPMPVPIPVNNAQYSSLLGVAHHPHSCQTSTACRSGVTLLQTDRNAASSSNTSSSFHSYVHCKARPSMRPRWVNPAGTTSASQSGNSPSDHPSSVTVGAFSLRRQGNSRRRESSWLATDRPYLEAIALLGGLRVDAHAESFLGDII